MLPLASLLACSLPANAQDVPSAYRGIWKQERISCTGETPLEPVRELEFLNDGDSLVTYQPFEITTTSGATFVRRNHQRIRPHHQGRQSHPDPGRPQPVQRISEMR